MAVESDNTTSSGVFEAVARAYALAMRNVSVYPDEHPRSRGAADDFLELVCRRGGIILTTHYRDLACNGARLKSDPQFTWLVERFRNAALRGVVLSPRCERSDLLEFSRQLVTARRGGRLETPFSWPADHARLRVLPLVFTGTFNGAVRAHDDQESVEGIGHGQGTGTRSARGTGARPTGRTMENLFDDPDQAPPLDDDGEAAEQPGVPWNDVPSITAAESIGEPSSPPDAQALGVGMLELLSEVIDDAARTAVTEVLSNADEAPETVTLDVSEPQSPVVDRLRMSATIAQRYFGRPGAKATDSSAKPSGRPEDESIHADLESFLEEFAELPSERNPVTHPDKDAAESRSLAHQLLGVYLYLFVAHPDEESRASLATPMRRAFAALDANQMQILDVYLGREGFRALSDKADRLALLELASHAGKHDVILERGYLDVDLIVDGFPDSIPLAARVLGSNTEGLRLLREAIERITMARGDTAFAELMGEQVLLDPNVVKALVAAGGECANTALSAVAWTGRLELYTALVEYLRTLDLPTPERRALTTLRPRDQGAASYLQQLLRESILGESSDDLRRRSGELLRRNVQRARSEDNQRQLLAAIDDLALVPDDKTMELLREYAGSRWGRIFGRLAPARARAHAVWQEIEGRKS